MKRCERSGAEHDELRSESCCPACSRELKKTGRAVPKEKACPECGKAFVSAAGSACCSRGCAARRRSRKENRPCPRCNKTAPMTRHEAACQNCRKEEAAQNKRSLTADIAVYFMALHGFTLPEAAKELRIRPRSLAAHLAKERAAVQNLAAYYTAEKRLREGLRQKRAVQKP